MNIEVRKLTPDLAEDYVHFFDVTPHDNNIPEHKCYCVCWCNDDYEGKDFSSAEKRRNAAIQYVKDGNIQGYLAYHDNEIVGWCNANTKSECLKCASWRRFMDYVPLDSDDSIKVKSIFCFTIAPEFQRKGIATLFLEQICKDAADNGFDFVEAYPYKESNWQSSNFGGYYEMYKKNGFHITHEADGNLVVRKALKSGASL